MAFELNGYSDCLCDQLYKIGIIFFDGSKKIDEVVPKRIYEITKQSKKVPKKVKG